MRPSAVLGIDPGKSGAFCVLDLPSGDIVDSCAMPATTSAVISILTHLTKKHRKLRCILEHAGAMRVGGRAQGGKAMFTYGRGFGALEASLEFMDIPFTLVHPRTWTSQLHATILATDQIDISAKAKSLAVAKTIWPKETFLLPRGRVSHDGFIDAALMAEYHRREILKGIGT